MIGHVEEQLHLKAFSVRDISFFKGISGLGVYEISDFLQGLPEILFQVEIVVAFYFRR